MINHIIRLVPLALIVFLVGCASPWERNYQANPLVERKFPPTSRVDRRVVEFERLENYEKAERQRRVESPVSPEDYTEAQRLAAKNRLLEALQLPDRGDSIMILGWSRFADTDQLNLRGDKLADFARKIGANVVVSSAGFMGQVNRIVDYPLTSYTNYYTYGHRSRGFYSTESSTVWVPTSVVENEYFYEAVFLRRLGHPTTAATGPSP